MRVRYVKSQVPARKLRSTSGEGGEWLVKFSFQVKNKRLAQAKLLIRVGGLDPAALLEISRQRRRRDKVNRTSVHQPEDRIRQDVVFPLPKEPCRGII